MGKSKFTNNVSVIGIVDKKEFNSKVGDGQALGNLTIKANSDRIYYDIFNPKKAKEKGRNVVKEYFDSINEGEIVEINLGSISQSEYEGRYNRSVSPVVSGDKGVMFTTKYPADSKVKHKAVVKLEGDIINKPQLRYDSLERFDNQNTAIVDLKFAYFKNDYNPETKKKEEITRAQVLLNELTRFGAYEKGKDKSFADLGRIAKWIKSLKEDDSIENVHKILNDFVKFEKPRMWNIDVLDLIAYSLVDEDGNAIGSDIALSVAGECSEHDNVSLGVIISNKVKVDEFGFVDGNINELEIKKLDEINEKYEGGENSSSDNNDDKEKFDLPF